MNEKQKIELGDFITDEVKKYLKPGCKLYFPLLDAGFLKIAELVLYKIHELGQDADKTPDPVKYTTRCICHNLLDDEIGYKGHICGVCYQVYCSECQPTDFEICHACNFDDKKRTISYDKTGNGFTAGDTLRNESSLTTSVKVLQINETHIVSDPGGCVEIQDFINAGWIVHERVTVYKSDGTMCFNACKFMHSKNGDRIGSPHCKSGCVYNKGYNEDQQWVICELYNEESEND